MPGDVAFLDHTADVGFTATAPDAPGLFHASALAMLALLRGDEEGDRSRHAVEGNPSQGTTTREIAVEAPDAARLLADWLRELLFLHEVEALDYESATFHALEAGDAGGARLRAAVRLRRGGRAVREIKGVTYHEIEARPTAGGWAARVIFDV